MKSSVIANVVEHDLCIGCGLCAALCPQEILSIQWNRYGEYNPVEVESCTTECGLCLKVCPFADSGEDEDTIAERLYGAVPGIQHRPETGYYLAAYVGYSERHRATSASGGMATWLLEALLAEGVVDHVICVAPTGDPERLFAFKVFDTAEDVRTGAGSAYYPVEMSEVIRQILDVPGRYAVTGLPCFMKAIRLAIPLPLLAGLGYYGVAAAGAIVLTLKNAVFTLWYATRVLGVGGHTFTRSMLPGIAATVLIGVAAATLGGILSLPALITLAVAGVAIALAYLMVVWEFGLNGFERGLFGSYLPKNL